MTAVVAEGSELILEPGNACDGGGLPNLPVSCDLSAVAKIQIELSDGDDVVDLARFDLPFTLNAGLGGDLMRLVGAGHNLDLVTLPGSAVQGVESLDIQGSGANRVTMNLAAVVNLVGNSGELAVLANTDDAVTVGPGWLVTGTQVQNGRFIRVLRQGETTLLLTGPRNWQHPLDRHDVNNNGTPLDPVGDILGLINEVNSPKVIDGSGQLPDAATVAAQLFRFYDVNGDGFLSAVGDILLQINEANRRATGEGERSIASAAQFLLPGLLASAVSPRYENWPLSNDEPRYDELLDAAEDVNRQDPEEPAEETDLARRDRQQVVAELDWSRLLASADELSEILDDLVSARRR
jgi:hypothetical protein